jgi:HEAT repeat protein
MDMNAKQSNQALLSELAPELQECCRYLEEWLGDADLTTCIYVSGSIGSLKAEDPTARERARRSIVRAAEVIREDSVPGLISGLRDSDYLVRNVAAVALRRKGEASAAAIPVLIDLLKQAEGSGRYVEAMVGWRACEALGAIGEAAVPALIPLLGLEEPTSSMAAYALGHIGPKAMLAVPGLIARIEQLPRRGPARWAYGRMTETLEILTKIDPGAAVRAEAYITELARRIG